MQQAPTLLDVIAAAHTATAQEEGAINELRFRWAAKRAARRLAPSPARTLLEDVGRGTQSWDAPLVPGAPSVAIDQWRDAETCGRRRACANIGPDAEKALSREAALKYVAQTEGAVELLELVVFYMDGACDTVRRWTWRADGPGWRQPVWEFVVAEISKAAPLPSKDGISYESRLSDLAMHVGVGGYCIGDNPLAVEVVRLEREGFTPKLLARIGAECRPSEVRRLVGILAEEGKALCSLLPDDHPAHLERLLRAKPALRERTGGPQFAGIERIEAWLVTELEECAARDATRGGTVPYQPRGGGRSKDCLLSAVRRRAADEGVDLHCVHDNDRGAVADDLESALLNLCKAGAIEAVPPGADGEYRDLDGNLMRGDIYRLAQAPGGGCVEAHLLPDETAPVARATVPQDNVQTAPSLKDLQDPVSLVWVASVLPKKHGGTRSDKIAEKMKRLGYALIKAGGKWHCERSDAIKMFPAAKRALSAKSDESE